ncbi:hypothetical protein ABFZ85_11640 [Hyphococcus formosus]|uniref:hypothetical protein n=1 Tax=Hyphococcus formosus TaxID=3143534 RepID=UPI00398BB8BE
MTVLEKAVRNLADALEALESKLDGRLDDLTANDETISAAKRQASAAREQTENASREIGAAISDLKGILEADEAKKGGTS